MPSDPTDRKPPTRRLPLLTLRDTVVFPHTVAPLYLGRERSFGAIERAQDDGGAIFLATQRDPDKREPGTDDLYPVGTVAHVLQVVQIPDGTVQVLVEGQKRALIQEFSQEEDCFVADVVALPEDDARTPDLEAKLMEVHNAFEAYVKLSKRVAPDLVSAVQSIDEPGQLADTVAGQLPIRLPDRQALLETAAVLPRLRRLHEILLTEIEVLRSEHKLRRQLRRPAERPLRERETRATEPPQLPKELGGERDEFKNELAELEDKVEKAALPKDAAARVRKELKKLKLMAPMSAEAAVVRNYIDWVLALPWGKRDDVKIDVAAAERVLEAEHYGLDKVKERILEYLAVQSLVEKLKGPILCLVGPPGVGKTSLARSIARATGRGFVRLALGGVRDEAEIRGHRRTYIGALPGKIVQSLRKAGTSNPVFLLDEIDKMSSDFRGDPASALLEVLDPEQNAAFVDHYLDLDYDLSDVMFIATANYLQGIPVPLQDRLEIIQLPGYTEFEKVAIAQTYLIPRQKKENGIDQVGLELSEDTIRAIIHEYTREAGVRGLERELATICRKLAKELVAAKAVAATDATAPTPVRITPKRLPKYLGPQRHRQGRQEQDDQIGLVNGLAVTMNGGDLLTTEVAILPGRGKLSLTGKLGDVMQESAQAAISYIRSRAPSLGLDRDFYSRADMHVHLPEGAIPKDGPSAGITMATAIVSALLRVPVRRDVAMTGEITLRGRVLPVGGVKEKILAAHRGGMATVILPRDNLKDVRDVPRRVLQSLKLVPVAHMDEVLRAALVLPNPGEFLKQPSVTVDWRESIERRGRADRREDPAPLPVATAAPPAAPASTARSR